MTKPNVPEQNQHNSAEDLIAEAIAIRALSASVIDSTDIGAAAVEYAIRNWPVLPLCKRHKFDPSLDHPHGKDPAIRGGHGVLDATTDLGAVIAWWGGRYAGCNIGLRVPSTMMVLDIDPRHGGLDSFNLLQRQHGAIPHCLTTLSGRGDGGRHLFMRRPPKRLSAAKLGPGIDLKTQAGYVVAPPSIHPDTGRPYIRVDGPIIEPPAWLVKLITVEPPAPKPRRPIRLDGKSVADEYNATMTWADVLEPHRWACIDADGDANGARWLHPTHTSNCSATVTDGRLYVYSTSTVFDVTEAGNPRGYSKFDALARLEHNGDFKAAARHLLAGQGGPVVIDGNSVETMLPLWPDNVALVANRVKHWVLGALKAGADDEEIAEATGLDCEQAAAIRLAVSQR
jgi:hypothetical protein